MRNVHAGTLIKKTWLNHLIRHAPVAIGTALMIIYWTSGVPLLEAGYQIDGTGGLCTRPLGWTLGVFGTEGLYWILSTFLHSRPTGYRFPHSSYHRSPLSVASSITKSSCPEPDISPVRNYVLWIHTTTDRLLDDHGFQIMAAADFFPRNTLQNPAILRGSRKTRPWRISTYSNASEEPQSNNLWPRL